MDEDRFNFFNDLTDIEFRILIYRKIFKLKMEEIARALHKSKPFICLTCGRIERRIINVRMKDEVLLAILETLEQG